MELSLNTFAAIALCAGCGDHPACSVLEWAGPPRCYAAQIFVARDAKTLVPMQADLDRYVDRWLRAVDAEPVLDGRIPQTYRYVPPIAIDLVTKNPLAVAAWKQRIIETGDTDLDAIVAQLRPLEISQEFANVADDEWRFGIQVRAVYNDDVLQAELAPTASWLVDPQHLPRDDGSWTWLGEPAGSTGEDGLTAQIDFTFGWGDCFVACTGFHRVRAVVPPTGDATVYDLGGDPLPPGMMLSPNTKPMP